MALTRHPLAELRHGAGRWWSWVVRAIDSRAWLSAGAWIATGVAALWIVAADRSPAVDDAWITFRYARNIARGMGYVYTPGEHLQATSTPLYTLLLAGLARLGIAPPSAARALGFVGLWLTAMGAFELVRRRAAWAGVAAAMLVLANGTVARVATSGMETTVYIALCLFALLAMEHGRGHLAFALGGLAALTRLDGFAVVGALVAMGWLRERRPRLGWYLWPLGLVGAWLVFSAWYFGRVLPHSLVAKRFHAAGTSTEFVRGLAELGWPHLALAAVAVAFTWRESATLLILTWVGLLVAMFSGVGLEPYFWYFAPPLVGLVLLAARGVAHLVLVLQRTSALLAAAVAVALFALAGVLERRFANLPCMPADERLRSAALAASLVRPTDTVAAEAVGMIGWYHDGPILDVMGLVSPATLAPRPLPYHAHALPEVIGAFRPSYVFGDLFIDEEPDLLRHEYFRVMMRPYVCRERRGAFVLWERR